MPDEHPEAAAETPSIRDLNEAAGAAAGSGAPTESARRSSPRRTVDTPTSSGWVCPRRRVRTVLARATARQVA
jgi:hypothetical protein